MWYDVCAWSCMYVQTLLHCVWCMYVGALLLYTPSFFKFIVMTTLIARGDINMAKECTISFLNEYTLPHNIDTCIWVFIGSQCNVQLLYTHNYIFTYINNHISLENSVYTQLAGTCFILFIWSGYQWSYMTLLLLIPQCVVIDRCFVL